MTHLQTLPLLEFLTPPAGWRTDRALLSSYSADLAVVVAFILALAARSDDGGTAGGAALARAMKELKGRCKFVVQTGRIAEPNRSSTILNLLDRFVVEVPWDESNHPSIPGRSWHAKIAIARQTSESDAEVPARWCLWLGSRNLSRDESWDIGLSLDGSADRAARGTKIKQMVEFADRLAIQAGQRTEWQPLVEELKRVIWDVPRGLSVEEIRLMLPDDSKRGFPKMPSGVRRILAVAPFLDGGTIKGLGSATKVATERQLLSTRPELSKLVGQAGKPLTRFNLLTLPEPTDTPDEAITSNASGLDAAIEGRGLHAKFIWAEHDGGASLWLGSPNLSDRAWRRNAEAYARVAVEFRGSPVASKALQAGIDAFVGHARNILAEDLDAPSSAQSEEELLETARKQVAARLRATQTRQSDGTVVIRCAEPPHADDTSVHLEIGRLTGSLVKWPASSELVTLPSAIEGRDSELLRIRLTLGNRTIGWVQRSAFDPPLGEARDDAALRDYLGIRGLLALISDLLTDLPSIGDVPWDFSEEQRKLHRRTSTPVAEDLPTLEQILRTWVREPARVRQAAEALKLAKSARVESGQDADAAAHLRSLLDSWGVIEKFLERETMP